MNWQELYVINQGYRQIESDDPNSLYTVAYFLINKHNNVVEGTYEDFRYAKKQAKYKYKKFIQLVERSLTD